jgi:acetyl esterase
VNDPNILRRRLGLGETGHREAGQSPVRRSLERFRTQVRREAANRVSEVFLRGVSATARRLLPIADAERQNVEVIRDVPYLASGSADHRLDIYRPTSRPGPHPVVFYVHGGGFTLLSKDTHWIMGMMFARYGYLVFNISYRLAPRHPYPAALEDTMAAYRWVVENAERLGGDLDRLVVAGESAGANLVSSLAIATSYPRPEPWAREVFDLDVRPKVAVPFCGIFQVSDTERFWRRRRMPGWVRYIIDDISSAYLRGGDPGGPGGLDLADPVVLLERGVAPDRPLPAFFLPVGTRDPLLDDTRRMKRALDRLAVPCRASYYKGEIHAFQALVMREPAKRCWVDTFAFIDQHIWQRLSAGGQDDDDDTTRAA